MPIEAWGVAGLVKLKLTVTGRQMAIASTVESVRGSVIEVVRHSILKARPNVLWQRESSVTPSQMEYVSVSDERVYKKNELLQGKRSVSPTTALGGTENEGEAPQENHLPARVPSAADRRSSTSSK